MAVGHSAANLRCTTHTDAGYCHVCRRCEGRDAVKTEVQAHHKFPVCDKHLLAPRGSSVTKESPALGVRRDTRPQPSEGMQNVGPLDELALPAEVGLLAAPTPDSHPTQESFVGRCAGFLLHQPIAVHVLHAVNGGDGRVCVGGGLTLGLVPHCDHCCTTRRMRIGCGKQRQRSQLFSCFGEDMKADQALKNEHTETWSVGFCPSIITRPQREELWRLSSLPLRSHGSCFIRVH